MPGSSNMQDRSFKRKGTRMELREPLSISHAVKKQRASSEQDLAGQGPGLVALGEDAVNTIQVFLPIQDAVSLMRTCKSLMSWCRIHILFYLVMRGKQVESEKILEGNSSLLLQAVNVTDPVNRTFKNIFIFQYALWSLDFWMCRMLLTYLAREEAVAQIKDWLSDEKKAGQHGRFFDLNSLVLAYMEFHGSPSEEAWRKLGHVQGLLPSAIVQDFVNSKSPFQISFLEENNKAVRPIESKHFSVNDWRKCVNIYGGRSPEISYAFFGSHLLLNGGEIEMAPAGCMTWHDLNKLILGIANLCEDTHCPEYDPNPTNCHIHADEVCRDLLRGDIYSIQQHTLYRKTSTNRLLEDLGMDPGFPLQPSYELEVPTSSNINRMS